MLTTNTGVTCQYKTSSYRYRKFIIKISRRDVSMLPHWSLRDVSEMIDNWFSSQTQWLVAEINFVTLPLGDSSFNLCDDKSSLFQLMIWCHTATAHYLNQYIWRNCDLLNLWLWGQPSMKFWTKCNSFKREIIILERCLQNADHFVSVSMFYNTLARWRHMATENWVNNVQGNGFCL